jgi:hypothetical protein
MSYGLERKTPLLTILKEAGNYNFYCYVYSEENISEKLPKRAVKEFISRAVFHLIHSAFFNDTYTLPTERTTLVTFPIGRPKIKLMEKDSQEVSDEPDYPQLAASVYSFLIMLNNAINSDPSKRKKIIKKLPIIRSYINIFKKLENKLLKGNVNILKNEALSEILYSLSNDYFLEMIITSSMVKELSPLILYLRYIAEPNDWLIFDEPKMNLHPEAQVKLIEFLTMLCNKNLNLLITTHSPYIVDHLVNLVKAYEHQDKNAIKNMFFCVISIHLFRGTMYLSTYLIKEQLKIY